MLINIGTLAQKTQHNNQSSMVEIRHLMRWDNYPKFAFSTHEVNISGMSWGINASYKFPVYQNIFIRTGVGYYKYSFDDIAVGEANARMINYPSPIYVNYHTDRYWYNSISMEVGVEKWIKIDNSLFLTIAANLINFYTFSQEYNIIPNIDSKLWKQNEKKNFGQSFYLSAGILKNLNKFSFGPSLLLPVYDSWSKDRVFPSPESPNGIEDSSSKRDKWFRGIGFSISCNYLLSKK